MLVADKFKIGKVFLICQFFPQIMSFAVNDSRPRHGRDPHLCCAAFTCWEWISFLFWFMMFQFFFFWTIMFFSELYYVSLPECLWFSKERKKKKREENECFSFWIVCTNAMPCTYSWSKMIWFSFLQWYVCFLIKSGCMSEAQLCNAPAECHHQIFGWVSEKMVSSLK